MPFECAECKMLGARLIFGLDGIRLCKNCKGLFKYRLISKTNALSNYKLKKPDLEGIEYKEVGNPLYRGAQNMILYQENEILNRFINKYFNYISFEDRNYLENLSNDNTLGYKDIVTKIINDIDIKINENKLKNKKGL